MMALHEQKKCDRNLKITIIVEIGKNVYQVWRSQSEMFGRDFSDDMSGMMADAISAAGEAAELTSSLLALSRLQSQPTIEETLLAAEWVCTLS